MAQRSYLPPAEDSNSAHTKQVYCLRTTPDYVASGSLDGSIRVWSTKSQSLALPPLTSPESTCFVAVDISLELDLVFGGDSRGKVVIWRLSDGSHVHTQRVHEDKIGALSLDAATLVATSRDKTASVWQIAQSSSGQTAMELQQTLRGHEMAVLAANISQDRIYTSAGDKTLRIWSRQSGELIKSIKMKASMTQFELVGGLAGPSILGGCSDGTIRIYSTNNEEELACIEGHTNVVTHISIIAEENTPKSLKFVSASYDGTVRIWIVQQDQTVSWACIKSLSFTDAVVTSLPLDQRAVDRDMAEGKPMVNRIMDMQIEGGRIYCCGEASEIVVWSLPS
ncbi:WD40-repeat-containing domain protein [Paraphoma chrysanthemicola]|uniref:WD40-repeat-containing domain protein n=1 Tax=Paraphoma chrysanthemicola TaxID=798071 RepID=A0A8K0R7T5_9PLEO|nr:WD40-repeat-containing domain protein [Paraphoma chrysanthemicola]